MKPYYEQDGITIYHGDCREIAPTLEGVTAVVSDPPYGLEFMGKEWDKLVPNRGRHAGTEKKQWGSFEEKAMHNLPQLSQKKNPKCKKCGRYKFDHPRKNANQRDCKHEWENRHFGHEQQAWFQECFEAIGQACLPGAMLLAFGGTRTYHRLVCAIEDAGFEIRDCIQWLYGSGFPKSLDVSKAIDKAAGAEREVVGVDPNSANRAANNPQAMAGDWKDESERLITTPSTDHAKTWNGYGTSLKPAFEPVVCCTKPLPPHYELTKILAELAFYLFSEDWLCRRLRVNADDAELISKSILPLFVRAAESIVPENAKTNGLAKIGFAQLAEKASTLNDPELLEASQRIAAGNAATPREVVQVLPTAIGMAADFSEAMEGGLSGLTDDTDLSTALSWRHILVDLWNQARTFTTETTTHLITDLKILRSLVTPTTSGSGTHNGETQQNGDRSNVGTVDALLKSVSVKSSLPEATIAADNAGSIFEDVKPSHEPICVAMKPLSGTYAANAIEHGVAGINVDGCRVGTEEIKTTGHAGDKYAKFKGNDQGESIDFGTHTGRWPANIIHDGSDEVVGLFPEPRAAGYKNDIERHAPKGKTFGGADMNCDEGTWYGDSGSAARFFYCAKESDREIQQAEDFPLWNESHDAVKNTHPTVKPLALMEYLVRLVTMPERNLILDPFMGSGSTLVACLLAGVPAIGIDTEERYCEIAANRLRQGVLF